MAKLGSRIIEYCEPDRKIRDLRLTSHKFTDNRAEEGETAALARKRPGMNTITITNNIGYTQRIEKSSEVMLMLSFNTTSDSATKDATRNDATRGGRLRRCDGKSHGRHLPYSLEQKQIVIVLQQELPHLF